MTFQIVWDSNQLVSSLLGLISCLGILKQQVVTFKSFKNEVIKPQSYNTTNKSVKEESHKPLSKSLCKQFLIIGKDNSFAVRGNKLIFVGSFGDVSQMVR